MVDKVQHHKLAQSEYYQRITLLNSQAFLMENVLMVSEKGLRL
jgi:hypothetical protein